MALQTNIAVAINALLTGVLDIGTVQHELKNVGPSLNLTTGTGANQADRLFTDTRTLAASANESLDLAGSLVDALGVTLTMARVKLLVIKAAASNVNNVIVGGVGANGWITGFGDATDKLVVRPGGFIILAAPDAVAYAVTAATADLLLIANSGAGTPVTYDIIVVGSSA